MDKQFLEKLKKAIDDNIDNAGMKVEDGGGRSLTPENNLGGIHGDITKVINFDANGNANVRLSF